MPIHKKTRQKNHTMSQLQATSNTPVLPNNLSTTVLPVILAIGFVHMMNDLIQSILPAIYPMIKENYHLTFQQIGLITLVYQMTASLLQPAIGLYTDKHAKPYLLPIGMCFTLTGLILLATAHSFAMILFAAALTGIGSSVFHPEASRIARMASGGRFGLAQSMFQVGGNTGSALGPLLAAAIVLQYGQLTILWFAVCAVIAIFVLVKISRWVVRTGQNAASKKNRTIIAHHLSKNQVIFALGVLAFLVFSKYIYMSSLTNYYAFYLMERFALTARQAQLYLFLFLGSAAAGTFIGGPIGDRVGRKWVIWVSILGVSPFTLMLPYANLFWTGILTVVIGLIIASAFSAIVVYAQELVPGKVGTIAGVFFGLMFGIGGVGAAVLGEVADRTSIGFVYQVCSFFPLLGIFTILLPNIEKKKQTLSS